MGYVTERAVKCNSCRRVIWINELQYDSPQGRICVDCYKAKSRQTTPMLERETAPPTLVRETNIEVKRETAIEGLCEHLRLMGLNATVEWKEQNLGVSKLKLYLGLGQRPRTGVIGSVRIADRNIDAVKLDWQISDVGAGDTTNLVHLYRCNYVVQLKEKGSTEQLWAESKPVKVKKGFLRTEIVDFRWEGAELAAALNNDLELKGMLYPPEKSEWKKKSIWTFMGVLPIAGFSQPQAYNVEIVPNEEDQSVRISRNYYHYDSPASAFPTAETFEAFDRIAHHIRTIANVPA